MKQSSIESCQVVVLAITSRESIVPFAVVEWQGCRNLEPEWVTIASPTFWHVCVSEAFHSSGTFRLNSERGELSEEKKGKCHEKMLSVLLHTCCNPNVQPSTGANSMPRGVAYVAPDVNPSDPRRRAILMRVFI